MAESGSRLHRLHLPIRLGTNQRRWAYTSFAVLWLSGVLWLVFHYFFQVQGDFGPRPHPLESWWLKLHGLAMMLTLLTLGTLIIHHLQRAWQIRKNRLAGAALAIVFGWLGITGYALFYFSSDANQSWLPLVHWLPGLLLPLVLVLHIYAGRKQLRSSASVISRRSHWGDSAGKKVSSGG
jgi:hypothetical protein